MAVFPGKGSAEAGGSGRLASTLGAPRFSLLIFGAGCGRLAYFMQKVMAKEGAAARPRVERETKGRGGQDGQIVVYLKKRFQLSFPTTGFHSIWEILESLDMWYYPEAFP